MSDSPSQIDRVPPPVARATEPFRFTGWRAPVYRAVRHFPNRLERWAMARITHPDVQVFLSLYYAGAPVVRGLTIPRPYPEGAVAAAVAACRVWAEQCRLVIWVKAPQWTPSFHDATDPPHGPLRGFFSDIEPDLREGQLVGDARRSAERLRVVLARIVSGQSSASFADEMERPGWTWS